ncbi:uncharacterized protein [Typha latifolia]|uniref:uncharacterized protein n=1 Tax=Typha latifolia TaxID=4733 RepID=UPI003C302A7A
MFCASWSSNCIPLPGLLCCSQFNLPVSRSLPEMRTSDTFISHPSFQNSIKATMSQVSCHGKTERRVSFLKYKRMGSGWKEQIQIPKSTKFKGLSIGKSSHIVKAVATVEPMLLVPIAKDEKCDTNLHFSSNSDSQVSQSSFEENPEIDDKEKLRRMRISKANKGNVPWNKGRKHSPETLQRIRERTKIAMQDPKVKMKLVNLGHAQSDETRIKIGVGVREGWQRRREKLTVQEGCFFQWQNIIAGAARNGFVGEKELQWDSYKILDEQLKLEWLESVEKRKTMPRPKGSKRAPKSADQRRKISEAISAKWADPGYRERVCTALAKYHGTPVGAEKRRRRPANEASVKRETVRRKPVQPIGIADETKSTKDITSRRKKNVTPSYKDPMSSTKLEMIKKIRAQRATIESKKREATERAKLLIAEAEKAAKSLEMAALKSPLAQASLVETRKLIAEAMRSIEGIENGQTAQDISDGTSSDAGRRESHTETNARDQRNNNVWDERPINGKHLLSSETTNYKEFDFDESTLQIVLNGREPLRVSESAENHAEAFEYNLSPSLQPESMRTDPEITYHVGQSMINGSARHNKVSPTREKVSLEAKESEVSISATKTKMHWVCGRLVEVEED